VQKTKNQFGLGFKKPNRPKIWHPFRRFSESNCTQSAIQIKSDKK